MSISYRGLPLRDDANLNIISYLLDIFVVTVITMVTL